jgi:hypothetical protein
VDDPWGRRWPAFTSDGIASLQRQMPGTFKDQRLLSALGFGRSAYTRSRYGAAERKAALEVWKPSGGRGGKISTWRPSCGFDRGNASDSTQFVGKFDMDPG